MRYWWRWPNTAWRWRDWPKAFFKRLGWWWRRHVTAIYCRHRDVHFFQGPHGETFCRCWDCDEFLQRAMTDTERDAALRRNQ